MNEPGLCEVSLIETVASDASADTVQAHLDRLSEGAGRLGIPYEAADVAAALRASMPGERLALIRLRLDPRGRYTLERRPLVRTSPARVCISNVRVRSGDPWLRLKTSRRDAYDRALSDARTRDCEEGLLANERNEITEGSYTNVFARVGGSLITPPVESGLLPGILRARLLRDGVVTEGMLCARDLFDAEEVFIGNSARGLVPARMIRS